MSESRRPDGRLPLRLDDRFFLSAHVGDDRLEQRTVGERLVLGCAAALLAELILDDEIAVNPTAHPGGPGRSPDFLREMRQGGGRDLRGRIEHAGVTAVRKVRSRLVLIDVLREVRVPGVLRGCSGTAGQAVDDQVGSTAEVL